MHKWSPIHLEYRFFHGGNSFLTSIPVFMWCGILNLQ
jgi:hypothetical protein